jgi:hypothetical protein
MWSVGVLLQARRGMLILAQVYFEDNAIPALVKRLLDNPQYFAVSANVVNNPALSWVHGKMGLYEGYYPVSNCSRSGNLL